MVSSNAISGLYRLTDDHERNVPRSLRGEGKSYAKRGVTGKNEVVGVGDGSSFSSLCTPQKCEEKINRFV
jgi:hypothetical protein